MDNFIETTIQYVGGMADDYSLRMSLIDRER